MILLHNKVVLEYQYEEPKSKEGILLSQSENTFKKGKITMVGAGVDIASSIKIKVKPSKAIGPPNTN